MVRVKISHGETLRRISLPDGPTDGTSTEALTLPDLHAALSISYPELVFSSSPGALSDASIARLSFFDEEGDACVLEATADLREALELTPGLLSVRIDAPPPPPPSSDFPLTTAAVARVAPRQAHPFPFLAALLPHAAGSRFADAVDAVAKRPPLYPEGVDREEVQGAVAKAFKAFVSRELEKRGRGGGEDGEQVDGGAPVVVHPSRVAVTGCLGRIGKLLTSAGVDYDRLVLVLHAVETLFMDSGLRHALFFGQGLYGLAKPRQSPIEYILNAATPGKNGSEEYAAYSVSSAAEKLKERLEQVPGDKASIFRARKKLLRYMLEGMDSILLRNASQSREGEVVLARRCLAAPVAELLREEGIFR